MTAGRLTTHLFLSTILFSPFYDSYTFSPMVYHVFLGLGTFPTYPSNGVPSAIRAGTTRCRTRRLRSVA